MDMEDLTKEDPARYHQYWEEYRRNITDYILNGKSMGCTKKQRHIIGVAEKLKNTIEKQRSKIIILEADKGAITVAVDKENGMELIQKMITDGISERKYLKITHNDTKLITKMHKGMMKIRLDEVQLEGLHKGISMEGMNNKVVSILQNSVYDIPKMRPVIKLHKEEGLMMRPIVSKATSINIALGKVLKKPLQDILDRIRSGSKWPGLAVKDSRNLADELGRMETISQGRFLTFDIKQMFDELPVDSIISIIEEHAQSMDAEYDIDTLMKLVKMDLTMTNYFTINRQLYKQAKGVPMGAPTSTLYAAIYVETCITREYKDITDNKMKRIWVYVDDILIYTTAKMFMTVKTCLERVLKMEVKGEEENTEGKLEFLDISIINKHRFVQTAWFKKPIRSERLLNFHTYMSEATKKNVICERYRKAIDVTDHNFLGIILETITDEIEENSYPIRFAKMALRKIISDMEGEEMRQKEQKIGVIKGYMGRMHARNRNQNYDTSADIEELMDSDSSQEVRKDNNMVNIETDEMMDVNQEILSSSGSHNLYCAMERTDAEEFETEEMRNAGHEESSEIQEGSSEVQEECNEVQEKDIEMAEMIGEENVVRGECVNVFINVAEDGISNAILEGNEVIENGKVVKEKEDILEYDVLNDKVLQPIKNDKKGSDHRFIHVPYGGERATADIKNMQRNIIDKDKMGTSINNKASIRSGSITGMGNMAYNIKYKKNTIFKMKCSTCGVEFIAFSGNMIIKERIKTAINITSSNLRTHFAMATGHKIVKEAIAIDTAKDESNADIIMKAYMKKAALTQKEVQYMF